MNLAKSVSISIALLLIQACSHPIEIEGEGDVKTLSGNRTCMFEGDNFGETNCSKNYVVFAYQETYYPEPRAGWKFDHWVNYCTTAPAPNYECSFSATAEQVKAFWGKTVPPLKAVFTLVDTDGDGVNDTSDLCPGTPVGEAVDPNGCALSQLDTDADGVSDASDACPNTPLGDMVDAQGCTVVLDTDTDGVPDVTDNCPNIANADQADTNNDGEGDACDGDDDGDGVLDEPDQCPLVGPNLNGLGCAAMNDSGITFGGNYPTTTNADCSGATIAQQDCANGRDATLNDNADGHAGFSYTKLASDGAVLPASAVSWPCVRDNVTGLVWEGKTVGGGIHDKENRYRWGGKTAQGTGYGTYYPDWDVLVDGSNTEALCGYTDWRVPTFFELAGLVNQNRTTPAIDTGYFPNSATSVVSFWSASPSAGGSYFARNVNFSSGSSTTTTNFGRSNTLSVRLVRGGQ